MNISAWFRRTWRLGLFGALFLLAACNSRNLISLPTAGGASPTPSTRNAIVVETDGQVEVRLTAGSEWQAATFGAALTQDSQVRTGAEGHLLLRLTEGTKIRVGPNTTFTFQTLNPFPENLLTALALDEGRVWVLLTAGALDVEMPGDLRAAARSAYLSVDYDADSGAVLVTCLQGQCYFNDIEIPAGQKLAEAQTNTSPAPMDFADYGVWGAQVPEATQFAYLSTEAVAQGNATMPIVATPTRAPSTTPRPTLTTSPGQPTPTLLPTELPVPTPQHTSPTATPVPFTPIPPAPIIGVHTVLSNETLYCIARGYGVLPGAIAQVNGLAVPFVVYPGQRLNIPEVQWVDISSGPVCAPQFDSPFPGLPVPTATNPAPALIVSVELHCITNCGSGVGDYVVQLMVSASGGLQPYNYDPAQTFEVTIAHCVEGQGVVVVTSADGQTVTTPWFYHDVSCAPTPGPPGSPPTDTPGAPPTPTIAIGP